MDYLDGLATVLGEKSQDVRPLKTVIEHNRVRRLLKPLGYRYVQIDSDEVTYAAGNPGISSVATPDSFTSLWLQKSVLSQIGGPFGFNREAADERFREAVRSAFSRLVATAADPGPKLVVFHTLIPHSPYVFGARGQSVTFPSGAEEAPASKLGMRYYVPQLEYLSRKLLETVDAIRAKSKSPPVIVIESDEGFEGVEQSLGSEANVQDVRVKGLIALSLPGVRNPRAPAPPNSVNALRYVLNRYFGTRYPMLRSASYPEGDYPYIWEEMRVRPLGVAK
jgi:hypothetical protein